MSDEVVFDSEKTEMRRRAVERSALSRIITPDAPKKDNKAEIVLTCSLGAVLAGSIFVAIHTRPKPVVIMTPIDAPISNPAIYKP